MPVTRSSNGPSGAQGGPRTPTRCRNGLPSTRSASLNRPGGSRKNISRISARKKRLDPGTGTSATCATSRAPSSRADDLLRAIRATHSRFSSSQRFFSTNSSSHFLMMGRKCSWRTASSMTAAEPLAVRSRIVRYTARYWKESVRPMWLMRAGTWVLRICPWLSSRLPSSASKAAASRASCTFRHAFPGAGFTQCSHVPHLGGSALRLFVGLGNSASRAGGRTV